MDVKICDICAKRIMDEPIICSLPFPQEVVITEDLNGRPVAKPVTKLLPLKVDLCEDCARKIFQAVLAAPKIKLESFNSIERR